MEKEILNYLTGSSETWQETGGQTEYEQVEIAPNNMASYAVLKPHIFFVIGR